MQGNVAMTHTTSGLKVRYVDVMIANSIQAVFRRYLIGYMSLCFDRKEVD